ncbi:CLUMA_CG000146, isoform A [Clunio marinus]|uniref:CLUMA_CG000146, isoform A n=1 Tax=Clunio marinus TaxID=568069 RepID=A0A1J1HIK3_9DIPT|nr:CLUMA_CG000146, isoform A [Clunio marinus]
MKAEVDAVDLDIKTNQIENVVDFDEALSKLGISFVFPVAECDLRLTTQHKGIISSISSIGIIVSSHMWGFLADTKGRKNVIIPTLVLSFIASLLSSLSTNFTLLVVFRFFSGFFVAGSSATIYAYLGEFHSSKNRSMVLMGASFIYGVACNYMPILGFLVLNRTFHYRIPILNIDFKPWRFYLLSCGLPSLLCAIVLLFLPESPKFIFSKGDEEETLNILKRIYKINNPKSTSDYNVTRVVEDLEFIENDSKEIRNVSKNPFMMLWNQTSLLFSKNNIKKTVLICLMQCMLFGSCHGLYMFFPEIVDKITSYSNQFPSERATICEVLLIENELTLNVTKYAVALKNVQACSEIFEVSTFGHSLVMELLYMFGFLIITFIINRISKLTILTMISFGCGGFGFATQIVTLPILSIYFYVLFMLTFLAVNVINATTIDLFPTNLRGMAINLAMMFGRIGSVLGTNMVGTMLDQYCKSTFALSAGLMVLSGVLAFFIPKIRRIDGRKNTN